jgi:hypothetical protein
MFRGKYATRQTQAGGFQKITAYHQAYLTVFSACASRGPFQLTTRNSSIAQHAGKPALQSARQSAGYDLQPLTPAEAGLLDFAERPVKMCA